MYGLVDNYGARTKEEVESQAHNILSNSQFGLQPEFSTKTALLSIINCWFSSFDLKNAVYAVFFNLTKAFDSVPHKRLFDSLSMQNKIRTDR